MLAATVLVVTVLRPQLALAGTEEAEPGEIARPELGCEWEEGSPGRRAAGKAG